MISKRTVVPSFSGAVVQIKSIHVLMFVDAESKNMLELPKFDRTLIFSAFRAGYKLYMKSEYEADIYVDPGNLERKISAVHLLPSSRLRDNNLFYIY